MAEWGTPRADNAPYWLEQGKVWIEYAPGRKRLVDLNRADETPIASSDFPCPMIRRDAIEPCVGMDGKTHESLSSLRKSYRADGNPQGQNYIEIGNEKRPEHKPKEFDRKQRRDDLHAAIADVKYGRVPTQTGN